MTALQIIDNFSQNATTYDDSAEIQRIAAERLSLYLDEVKPAYNSGDSGERIVELGCGTGLFSAKLLERFEASAITLTDASREMLDLCRERMAAEARQGKAPQYRILDIENGQSSILGGGLAILCASFVLQWFKRPEKLVIKLAESLKEERGALLFSMPGNGSFSEWKTICRQDDLEYTANELPDFFEIAEVLKASGQRFKVSKEIVKVKFASPLAFFQSLKRTGARTRIHKMPFGEEEQKNRQVANFRAVLKAWQIKHGQEEIEVSYELITGYLVRQ